MKKKTRKRVIKVVKIIIIAFIVFSIYNIGMFAGIIQGAVLAQEKHNETLCDFLDKERDVDGFCLLTNKTQKYRYYLDCGYEKFKINGEKKLPYLVQVANDIQGWLTYPILRC